MNGGVISRGIMSCEVTLFLIWLKIKIQKSLIYLL